MINPSVLETQCINALGKTNRQWTDAAGRKTTEAVTIGGQTYTTSLNYDVAGQLTGYTFSDGSVVARSYNDRGQLYQLKFDGTTIDTRVYDNGGRMTSSSYNNGVSESRSHNNDNTLASISFTGAPIGTYSYGWDDNKNKTNETISGPTHELLTAAGQSLTHDTRGNMTLVPTVLPPNATSLALTWDFENKMTTADIGNNSSVDVTYKWDALGRRVYRDDGTSAYVYAQVGQQTIADYGWGMAPASPKYNYVYASYIDEPVMREEPSANERLFLHRSQQFSTVALTTSTATIAERYAYSAYGAPTVCNASGTDIGTSTKDNRITYTGREWDDELVLYHFRARLYDAAVGRFLGRDPKGFADSFNEYFAAFIGHRVDPEGTCAASEEKPIEQKYPCGKPFNNKGEEHMHTLCTLLCEALPVNDPTEIKQLCNHWPKPINKICETLIDEASKRGGIPTGIKSELCSKICCTGKLKEPVPGSECLREFFGKDGSGNTIKLPLKDGAKKCLRCCDRDFANNQRARNRCRNMCTIAGGGIE